ncbi:hypothetical protein ABOM_003787 [Aspergillus bombycis]|uniref:Dienelactone hydrolase domain-containing protein n=1 Tax=Aspergillus bombycis TaxID=109264 RepID=A0A1F8A6K5_9EURO|nr:hypothetical protein ABOM_003787 [Aspergillus bombycis]OGM47351.1 hypothetical protein ABOM_003787 [Aspergillus bombycis]
MKPSTYLTQLLIAANLALARRVTFPSRNLTIVGELYLPESSAPNRNGSAIVVGHPYGGVKEQTAGLYAKHLSENGFLALAFDAGYQGESSGSPHFLEDPGQRVEDFKAAVSYLTTLDEVNPENIGALGICASGGYVPFAAQTDLRMKAVATVSAVDVGSLFREGLKYTTGAFNRTVIEQRLKEAGELRTAEAHGAQPELSPIVPEDPNNLPADLPTLWREASQYYRTSRGYHPRAPNRVVTRSLDQIVNFWAFNQNALISPRPFLVIAGSAADSLYFSQQSYDRALEPKELFQVPGETHVGLYDNTTVSGPKLVSFFSQHLPQ